MAGKRQATSELQSQPKRVQTSAPNTTDNDKRPEDEEDNDDDSAPSSPSYYLSQQGEGEDDEPQLPTPLTPFSPTPSAKYPSDLKTHVCPYDNCGKAFNRPARLSEHIRSHTNDRIFTCEHAHCDKTFLRASHLNHHVKSAHTAVRDYACDRAGCGKTFVTGSRLRRHLAAHEGRDKYRCTEYPPCSETFRKHSTLQKHVMMAHLNRRPFPCSHVDPRSGEKCAQAFDTSGHLRAHEGRVHGGSQFVCTECSTTTAAAAGGGGATGTPMDNTAPSFPTYALLQAHIKSVHPPACPECQRTCSSTRELRRHLEITHGSVPLEERRVHACSHPGCGRSFTKRGNLNVHVRTVHEGEKRFVCGLTDLSTSTKIAEGANWSGAHDGCGRRYGSKLALEEHVRTAHLGLKNAKAARREQLGLDRDDDDDDDDSTSEQKQQRTRSGTMKIKGKKKRKKEMSGLAMLTGEGYAEESGRHIPCLVAGCEYRFFREYDLWQHMGRGKHGLEQDDIQLLFMRRAMEGGDQSFDVEGFALAPSGGGGYGYGYGEFGVYEEPMGVNDAPDPTRMMMCSGGVSGTDGDDAVVSYQDSGADGIGVIDPRLTCL